MDSCINFTIRKASRALNKYFNKKLLTKRYPLMVTQIQMLWTVKKFPDQNITFISKILAMDRTTTSRNASILIREGFIETKKVGDKRNIVFVLTQEGTDILEKGLNHMATSSQSLSETLKFMGIDSKNLYAWLSEIASNFYDKSTDMEKKETSKKNR